MLLLPKFEYLEPRDLSEACRVMKELKEDVKVLAGGTDVLVNMKKGVISPKHLMSIGKIPGISEVEPGKASISIGSNLIVTKLTEFEVIKKRFSVLGKAAATLGSPLIRNRATIGGNIVTARPAADLPPALMVMGARLKLQNAKGTREVPLDGFFVGPGQTIMSADEILTGITIDDLPPCTGGDYLKLGHRKALEIAIVAVAARISLDGPDGVIKEAKIVLSSVAPTAIHAVKAEKMLIGEKPTEALFVKAAQMAGTECTPIDDIRGGAEYRCAMVEVLTKRTLRGALNEAQSK